jgi:hypothetical protein
MTETSTITNRAQQLPSPEQVASVRRLEAVREILRALETATAAGQQHLMMKVLGLLRREAPAGDSWMNDHQWNKIASGLEVLAHEANRLAPDADAFKRQATIVADALALS